MRNNHTRLLSGLLPILLLLSGASSYAQRATLSGFITDASNEIMMNEDLFARVKAVYEASEGLTREQQMVVKKLYQSFERNGVGLEPEAKKRFAEINTRLATLSQKFGQNLLPRPR